MITSKDISVNIGGSDVIFQPLGNNEIVDAPSCVVRACIESIGPPGVGACLIGIEDTEGISEARRKEFAEFSAFLIRESCFADIGFGVLEINLLFCYIQVAAQDHRFYGIKLNHISAQSILKFHAVVDAGKSFLGIRGVAGDEIKIFKFCSDDSAFVCVFSVDTECDRQRSSFAEDSCAGITFLFCAVEILAVSFGIKICLARLHFGFLQAEDIGIDLIEKIRKAFFQAGAESIDIP